MLKKARVIPDWSIPLSPVSVRRNFTVLAFTPRSSQWTLTFKFPYQNPTCTSPLPQTCHIPSPSHYSTFDHPNNMWSKVRFIRLLIIPSPPFPSYLATPRPPVLPQHPILEHPQPMFHPHYRRSCSGPHKTGKVTLGLILIFIFLDQRARTPALTSSSEVTGVRTQDVCSESICILFGSLPQWWCQNLAV